jgi:pectinesterase
VQDEEPYIGFFAAEKKCISDLTEDYLKARRAFFLGVDKCEEDPEEYIEPFLEFCKTSNLLTEDCDQNWEKKLSILSYELYGNKPIFDYKADNIIAHRNLVFAEYPNKKLELDLFLPEKPIDTPVPLVVCVHGGGWRVNRRIWFEPFAQYLASKGIAAVTIDYRMLPAVNIIDCVYDTKAAVRWVRANAKKYNIDPERIGAIGASAGAHLVALLGTTADVPEIEGTGGNSEQSSAVQAVVGIATPSFRISEDTGRRERWGMSKDDMKLISPYENISSKSAPLYLIHGSADQTVPPGNSQELYDKYQEAGVHVELTWIPDEGHGFYEGTDIAIAMASDFFKKVFMDKKE